MMEEFQFTGDTPALYYAQAAWEYKHDNAQKAEDWTNSANKIYSPALNNVFADAFYDVGWLQRPEGTTAPAVAFDTSNVATSQAEGGPAVEPSPIPNKVLAANKQDGTLALAPAAGAPEGGMELAGAGVTTTNQPTTALSSEASTETSPQPQPATSESPATDQSTTAPQAVASEAPNIASASTDQSTQQAATQPSPSGKSAVATAASTVSSLLAGGRRMWLVGGLLLAGLVILAWVLVPVLRRHAFTTPRHLRLEPPRSAAAAAGATIFKPSVAESKKGVVQEGNGFFGGPRQVSLQLKPWNPAVRQSASPSPKAGGAFDRLKGLKPKPSRAPAHAEPQRDEPAPVAEPFSESVGPVLEQTLEVVPAAVSREAQTDRAPELSEFAEASINGPQPIGDEIVQSPEEPVFAAQEASEFSERATEEAAIAVEEPDEVYAGKAEYAWPAAEPSPEFSTEPVGNDQPQEAIFAEREGFAQPEVFAERQAPVVEATPEAISDFQPAIPAQPVFPQTTTPATMPETTQTPPAPIAKAPAPPVPKPQPQPQAPVPVGGMQTSVQLTFSFEIAAMQLTPSFKMGVLKVRPISKLVTMRLPSPQRTQSALNLQVAFEVVKIQPVAGALGTIRVVPSQQQRPAMGGMPSFAVAGLQVVPNSETAPVQLTPSPQGRASVFITVPFQISTLEFSPTLEIGSVTLNSNSKQVVVQLPGTGAAPAEGAPMFEIASLELNEGGEIVMMQLNLLGGPKRA
jgi:hypothetical protein